MTDIVCVCVQTHTYTDAFGRKQIEHQSRLLTFKITASSSHRELACFWIWDCLCVSFMLLSLSSMGTREHPRKNARSAGRHVCLSISLTARAGST